MSETPQLGGVKSVSPVSLSQMPDNLNCLLLMWRSGSTLRPKEDREPSHPLEEADLLLSDILIFYLILKTVFITR